MSNRVFYISGFDNDISMSVSGEIALGTAVSDRTDVSATAFVYVDISRLSHVFHFTSDAVDVSDGETSDIQFDISAGAFMNLFNASNKSLLGNAQVAFDTNTLAGLAKVSTAYKTDAAGNSFSTGTRGIKYDVIRDLASQLFNTYHGVDLFTNEGDLRNNAHDRVNAIVNSTSSGIPKVLSDCSRNTYDQTDSNNVGSEILRQLIAAGTGSVSLNIDTSGSTTGFSTDASLFYMPFEDGDALQFILNVAGADNQKALVGGSGTTHRRYDVRIVASTNASGNNVDASNNDV